MARILVSGLINIETTLKVESFPIHYQPVSYPFFGINTTVSGVGLNISKALTTLGDEVRLCSLVGRDLAGSLVRQTLIDHHISAEWVIDGLANTCQSLILYAPDGSRMIFTDLKDIQETPYPQSHFDSALNGCDVCVLCNINYSRPFLSQAKAAGKLIVSDVHAISDLDDTYNRDFMSAADILFLSDAKLPIPAQEWARELQSRYGTPILVIGMGAHGALLAVNADNTMRHYPAVRTRPVINTVGAGDALLSSFLHYYLKTRNPYDALDHAMIFASYKIGAVGAAEGFLDDSGVEAWKQKKHGS
ncbi:MAG: carbohydrate kinase family protein [Anaerolineae bacterium]|nr:carbohydrate kinase family protein [Anaerolineae bacterium]